jgi:hypothetical protein
VIGKAVEDTRKYFEETVGADFYSMDTISKKITVVVDFAESVGHDFSHDIKNTNSQK